MNKLKQHWSDLSASLWFFPAQIIAGSIIFALVLIEIDSAGLDLRLARWPRLFGAGAEGARAMLSTIAGSMMSVMGVTFSMMLVAMALASSQYTSRMLRNFMRSRVIQWALGIFAGIFTYCLIVLRTIRGNGEVEFIPSLAVFVGFVLAIGSIIVLIIFINHIASSIQASSIVASVAKETSAVIDRLFPEEDASPEEDNQKFPPLAERNWRAIPAIRSGYIQNVDSDALLLLARDRKTIVRMERGVGEFVVENTTLASLALDTNPAQEVGAILNAAYTIRDHRTVDQDPTFGIRQIVDMALKALSPGVNDVSTAVVCVDSLSVILARLASRAFPNSRHFENGELRVIAVPQTFEALLNEAFDQIRSCAEGNVAIMTRMLGALQTIAGLTSSLHRLGALSEHVQWIADLADRTIKTAYDRERIELHIVEVRTIIEHACRRDEAGMAD